MGVPEASRPLGVLSPSQLDRLLACPLKIAFEQRGSGGVREYSPQALVGLTAHEAILLILTRDETPDAAWTQATATIEAKHGADPSRAVMARRTKMRLERRLPEASRVYQRSDGLEGGSEAGD